MDHTSQDGASPAGNMLRCGCPLGRPCTCEMGAARRGQRDSVFACGDEYLVSQQFELLELSPDCVLRMRRPDWAVQEKSAFYTRIRQLRLAMLEALATSSAVLDKHRRARKKLNRDLVKAKDALRRLDELKKAEPHPARRTAIDYSHVDSDVFDSFSKQLIPAETLLPDVRARLERVNTAITHEETSIKIICRYVRDVAATKLQQSVRDFLHHERWKRIWRSFQHDVQLAAAVTIQATYRMYLATLARQFLLELRHNKRKERAAAVIRRFFRAIAAKRRADAAQRTEDARRAASDQKRRAVLALERVFARIACRRALLVWREEQRQATAHQQLRTMRSVVTIQRMYRGYRDRLYLKRTRLLAALSQRVRSLVDDYLCSGNFWGFVLQVDADYRRFEHTQREEEEHALTFVSTVLKQRKLEDDQRMQEWFAASAMQSPIVHGARRTQSTYGDSASPASLLSSSSSPSSSSPSSSSPATQSSTASPASSEPPTSWSQALLEAPIAADLIALSPHKRKADVFPTDLPPKVIRSAMAEGFAFDDIIAVLRGLQAQRKDVQDVSLVLKALYQRAPLMTTSWKSERTARLEALPAPHPARPPQHSNPSVEPTSDAVCQQAPAPRTTKHTTAGAPTKRARGAPHSPPTKPPHRRQAPQHAFITENLVESIPGGLNASIARIVLVAAIKAFDPDASAGDGAFVLAEDFSVDPFESYLALASPLLKIRWEHQVLEAAKPFIEILTENRCWSGYDLLYNVRGVDELVAWTVPRPLALSIYDVLEQIHTQTVRLSSRAIARELFISPSFDRFVHARQRAVAPMRGTPDNDAAAPPDVSRDVAPRPASPVVAETLKHQIRTRLERDVLQLPIERTDALAVVDVLFKAAFLVWETPATAAPSQTSRGKTTQSYDAFLDALVAFESQRDAAALRSLIRDRVSAAKLLANEHAAALALIGIATASDLITRAHDVAARLDAPLARQVQDLLAPVASTQSPSHSTDPLATAASARAWGRKSKAALLHASHVSKATAQLSPLLRHARHALSSLDADDVDSVAIPF